MYYDEALESPFDEDEPINGDLTLYGKYAAAEYAVTFDPNGGTFKPEANVVDANNQKKVAYNSTVTLPTAEQMTAPSTTKTLAGWYTDAALTTAFDPATKITRNITLYAKYLNVVEITLVASGWTYDGTAHAATAMDDLIVEISQNFSLCLRVDITIRIVLVEWGNRLIQGVFLPEAVERGFRL